MKRKTITEYIEILLLIVIPVLSVLVQEMSISYSTMIRTFSFLGVVQYFIIVQRYSKNTNNLLNQYTFFFSSYFLFSFGQIALFLFGIEYDKFNLLIRFEQHEIIAYSLFYLFSTTFLALGTIKMTKSKNPKNISLKNTSDTNLNIKLKRLALILFVVSAPVYVYILLNYITISLTVGYSSIYDSNHQTNLPQILTSLEMFFIPSLFMLTYSYKENFLMSKIIKVMFLLVTIGLLMTGSRSRAFALVLTMVFYYSDYIRSLKLINIIPFLVVIIMFVSLIPSIQKFRNEPVRDFATLIEVLEKNGDESNVIVDTVGEMGGSMQPWLLVNRLIPSQYGYGYGISYISSFLAIIPSKLTFGISFSSFAQLSTWLQNAANMNYGPGFSMLAESQYNFGIFGPIMMFFIGKIYYLMISDKYLKRKVGNLSKVFVAIALFTVITSGRNSLYLSVRTFFYTVIIPVYILTSVNSRRTSSTGNQIRV